MHSRLVTRNYLSVNKPSVVSGDVKQSLRFLLSIPYHPRRRRLQHNCNQKSFLSIRSSTLRSHTPILHHQFRRYTSSKMVKDNETVIEYAVTEHVPPVYWLSTREFNELVNMTASELEKWLKSEDSTSSGWSKEDGSGETIGHERLVTTLLSLVRCSK